MTTNSGYPTALRIAQVVSEGPPAQVISGRQTTRVLSEDRPPQVDIVVPVYNEQGVLGRSIRELHGFLAMSFPLSWRIVIADNASVDATPTIAHALARELPHISVLTLVERGRGRALRTAWLASDADVVCYMDVDLSTDLRALRPLISALVSDQAEVAIGSRLAGGALVLRGFKREFVSRAYNLLLRAVLRARFSDAQCGFKAMRRDVAQELLPEVRDDGWFFDTELLVLAQRAGMRIHEVPVQWTDDPDSRVKIVRTALGDLRGVARLLRQTRLGPFDRAPLSLERSTPALTAQRPPRAVARTPGNA